MFYFACPCGRQGPRDSDEDLLVLYLIRNPLDPSDTIDVALPWPFCHLVVRVVVIAESKAAKPILRCAHNSTRIEMTMEERTLAFPDFALSYATVMPEPVRAGPFHHCGVHTIFLDLYKPLMMLTTNSQEGSSPAQPSSTCPTTDAATSPQCVSAPSAPSC